MEVFPCEFPQNAAEPAPGSQTLEEAKLYFRATGKSDGIEPFITFKDCKSLAAILDENGTVKHYEAYSKHNLWHYGSFCFAGAESASPEVQLRIWTLITRWTRPLGNCLGAIINQQVLPRRAWPLPQRVRSYRGCGSTNTIARIRNTGALLVRQDSSCAKSVLRTSKTLSRWRTLSPSRADPPTPPTDTASKLTNKKCSFLIHYANDHHDTHPLHTHVTHFFLTHTATGHTLLPHTLPCLQTLLLTHFLA